MRKWTIREFCDGLTEEEKEALRAWFILQDDIAEVTAVYESGSTAADEKGIVIPETAFEEIARKKREIQNTGVDWDEAAREAIEQYCNAVLDC